MAACCTARAAAAPYRVPARWRGARSATASSCSPRQVVALARLHNAVRLLAVTLDRGEHFGARVGVTVHAHQHRGECVHDSRIVGVELTGAAQRASASCSRLERASTLAEERCRQSAHRARAPPQPPEHRSLRAGGQAAPAGHHARPAAPDPEGRRQQRHPARPAAAPASQRHSRRPPGAAHIPACEATGAAPPRTPIPPSGLSSGQHQREAQGVPGFGPAGRYATATKQQIARIRTFAAHDQQTCQPKQRRLAPWIDFQHAP